MAENLNNIEIPIHYRSLVLCSYDGVENLLNGKHSFSDKLKNRIRKEVYSVFVNLKRRSTISEIDELELIEVRLSIPTTTESPLWKIFISEGTVKSVKFIHN